ncbi:ferritin family protein [Myxococcota bacterium]
MNVNSFRELLDFAIDQEQQAFEFYTELADRMAGPHMRAALLEFAEQERGHKAKLEAVRSSGSVSFPTQPVGDLKIADYVTEVQPHSQLDYREALVVAMHQEKAAYRLYHDLGRACDDSELKEMFRFLAREEAAHKLLFETQYDEMLGDN